MENITAGQQSTIDVLGNNGLQSFQWSEHRGVAAFARGDLGDMGSAPMPAVLQFLRDFGEPFGPPGFASGLRHIRTRTDSIGWLHFEFQQTYSPRSSITLDHVPDQDRSFDVHGGFVVAHVNAAGRLIEIQSSCWRDVVIATDQTPIDEAELRRRVLADFIGSPGAGRLFLDNQPPDLNRVLIRGQPQLVVYPISDTFRLAWQVRGLISKQPGLSGQLAEYLPGELFFDAHLGSRIAEGVFVSDVDNPDVGSGLSNLPFGGPYTSRNLDIIRVDASNTYRLRDTTHSRDIITYDFAGAFPDYLALPEQITDGSLTISTDSDGDKNWSQTAADDSAAALTGAQQTEVDAHYHVGRIYEWYDAVAGGGGRAGFDDGNYGSAVPSNMPVHVLAHVAVNNAQFYNFSNDSGEEISWLLVSDSISDAGHRAWGASPYVMCHEYQHGITAHSVSGGNPGFSAGFDDWPRAITEGLSDVFGGVYADGWHAGREISPAGTILRNLAFPRDTEASSDPGKDHFTDFEMEDAVGFSAYQHGQILPHCAYLMSQGGVHQRAGRSPELIPTHGLGKEEVAGLSVATAARIWYRMMETRFGAIAPYTNAEAFERIRTECVASAIDLFGENSHEHRETIQAFYAVGLHPDGETYGADVTFLPWGYRWRFSRPYIGLSSPNWSSLDLFINNGGTSDWNAIANAEGSDVVFQNNVYCRVRNVGDQTANNVQVTFEYAAHGTAPVVWQTMVDADGVAQQLNLDSLVAGASNFAMDSQDSPPAEAGATWHIPPIPLDEEVTHFCIRATVTSGNDVHPFNNTVQSNVAYTVMSAMMSRSIPFNVGNPSDEPLPAVLVLEHTLPPGWGVKIREDLDGVVLTPGEERRVHLDLDRPAGPDFEAPFDGEIRGEMCGEITGAFTGLFTNVQADVPTVVGLVSLRLQTGILTGRFVGTIDIACAEIEGTVTGTYQCAGSSRKVCVKIRACLRPHRRIDIRQMQGEQALGGVTFQVQLPLPEKCDWPTAPTDTEYRPGLCALPQPPDSCSEPVDCVDVCVDDAIEGKIVEIRYNCFGDFEGLVVDLCGDKIFCKSVEPAVERVALKAFRRRWTVKVGCKLGSIRSISILR